MTGFCVFLSLNIRKWKNCGWFPEFSPCFFCENKYIESKEDSFEGKKRNQIFIR